MNENEKLIEEKVEFFMNEKVMVHIKLNDRNFLNGTIEKKSKEGIYWFKDRELDGVFLFLKDIYHISKFKQKEG